MESHSRAAFHAAFRVGEWTVRPSCCRIEREGIQRHLRPMLMDILILLSEHAGAVVSKDQILARVWDNRAVSESTLSRDIAVLRRLLGDDARRPSYIETISKRGLRLVAPVTALATRVQPRIAVLPFENLNRDANEYLADGFTDALITELSRLPQMLVISRQSMLRFRGSPRTIPEIAAELRATALVEGSLVRVGDRIRVSAQLLDGPSDEHLWADTYEAENAVPLSSLCRVAAEFARSIHSILVPEVVVPPSPAREIIDAAHIEYLKYRYHFAKWTEEGLHKSLAHLQHALEIDPTYAQAYGGLAWSLAILGYWGFMPIEEAYPRAKAAAMQAISLDPCSEAHTALALVKWFHDWDLAGTRSELRRAIETNPSNESAHILRGLFLAAIERDHDGAVEEAKRTLDLDPLSPMSNFSAAWLLVFAGELEQGADRARRTLLLYPDSPLAMYALGWAQIGLGRISEASATFERAATVAPGWTTRTYLAFAYGRAGRRKEAFRLLRRLTAGAGDCLPDFAQALIHIGLGDCDRALDCLERALAERDSRIFPFAVLPGLDALRRDPRFGDLMHRVAAACQN